MTISNINFRTLVLATISSFMICTTVSAADAPTTISLNSKAFEHEGDIPLLYSAYGDNTSPDLVWTNLPAGTKQLALILDDPVVDMPQPFVHWVAYNIPVTAEGLPSALSTDPVVADPKLSGMINGLNGTRRSGYFGPRPPVDGKVHRYNFRIYALDAELDLPEGINKDALLDAMSGHVLATGLLTGHYQQFE